MNEEHSEIVAVGNRNSRTLLLGGLIGASVGLLAAYLLLQRSDKNQPVEFSAGEGVKIGVLVFGLLRSIANL
jgi:hypothetical protein